MIFIQKFLKTILTVNQTTNGYGHDIFNLKKRLAPHFYLCSMCNIDNKNAQNDSTY